MASSSEVKKPISLGTKVAVAAAAIVTAAAVTVAAVTVANSRKEDSSNNNQLAIGYASEATVLLDQTSLQAAMDEAMQNAKDGNIGLYYQNDATSKDGIEFDCFIGNSSSNIYDMFLTIYTDAELTDQIFLSGLVPPGSGFEHITLEHELEPGVHEVYVALTLVDTDEDTGDQTIKGQVVHTMDFHVSEG